MNGLKHGLAAKVPVLPGEDPAEFQAHIAAIVDSYGAENQVELELLERVAAAAWSLDRAQRAEAAAVTHRLRHEALDREAREQEQAIALGQRLLWDARGPWQLYPHHPHTGLAWEERVSWSEDPGDPNNPAILVCRLERTVAGCRWLLDRWAELLARLEPGEVWAACDQFKAVRLLGKQPLDAVDNQEVAQIFLASARLLPEGSDAKPFAPVKSELCNGETFGVDEQSIYSGELKKRPLSKLRPADADAAREVLRALVDRQVARLNLILAQNQEIAEADAAEAPARLAFDSSPDGEKRRRYALSAARLINQTLGTLVKIRAQLSVVGGPLSVVGECVVGAPLSVEDMQTEPNADLQTEPNPALQTEPMVALQTEPNLEPSRGEHETRGGGCLPQPAGGAVAAREQIVQTEPKTEVAAGQEPARSARVSGHRAVPAPGPPRRRLRDHNAKHPAARASEKVFGEERFARLNRVFETLVKQENAEARKRKAAKRRARKPLSPP